MATERAYVRWFEDNLGITAEQFDQMLAPTEGETQGIPSERAPLPSEATPPPPPVPSGP